MRLLVCLFSFSIYTLTGFGQAVPTSVLGKTGDYSYMWWTNKAKTSPQKGFAIKSNYYALSFDYTNLTISNFLINKAPTTSDVSLREAQSQSFPTVDPTAVTYSILQNTSRYRAISTSNQMEDCQVVESGKYVQRRFIEKVNFQPGAPAQDVYNTGVEVAAWPDRLTLLMRYTPTAAVTAGTLEMTWTAPAAYPTLIQNGAVQGFKAADGSGFLFLKSSASTSFSVNASTRTVTAQTAAGTWTAGQERNVGIIIYPIAANIDARLLELAAVESQPLAITAQQTSPTSTSIDVQYDQDMGAYHFDLRNDGNTAYYSASSNNRIEKVAFSIPNTTATDRVVRLNFAKERKWKSGDAKGPYDDVFGVTGLSAVLRDNQGNPVGLPVQLTKNFHPGPDANNVPNHYYRGVWYHGYSQLVIPANTTLSLEYVSVNALWGTLPAASESQVSLVGCCFNFLWNQQAIGSWGETITYGVSLDTTSSIINDFRPLYLKWKDGGLYNLGGNHGGAGLLNYTRSDGKRSMHTNVRTQYKRYSPNLTETTYAGVSDDDKLNLEYSTAIYRSEDMTRGLYKVRMKVLQNTKFKNFSIFELGTYWYHATKSAKLAVGNTDGLTEEWNATINGTNAVIGAARPMTGRVPWVSMHQSETSEAPSAQFYDANRGFVIRSWKAQINCQPAIPYLVENSVAAANFANGGNSSNLYITTPPGVTEFKAGDYIEADIEVFLLPKVAANYYGTNQNLKNALATKADTWQMVYREATGNDLTVTAQKGTVLAKYPIRIGTTANAAVFQVKGGMGYVPVTFSGVSDYQKNTLYIRQNNQWKAINQAVYGKDFWQTDFDPATQTWDLTFNINLDSPNDIPQTLTYAFGDTLQAQFCGGAILSSAIDSLNHATCGLSNGRAMAIVQGGLAPYTYAWTTSPVQTTPLAIDLAPGSYTVTTTDAAGCTTTSQVSLTQTPAVSLSITSVTCAPDLKTYSITFSSDGTVTTNVGSLSGTTVSAIPAGQLVSLTACSGSCLTVVSATNDCPCPVINPPVSGGDKAVCLGTALPPLTVTVGIGESANWYDSAGNLMASATTTYMPTTEGSYFAEAYSILSGCKSTTRTTVTVTVNALPTITIDPNQIRCSDDALTYELAYTATANAVVTTTIGVLDTAASKVTGIPTGQPVLLTATLNSCTATATATQSCTATTVSVTVTAGDCLSATNQYTISGVLSVTSAVAGSATVTDGTASTTIPVTAGISAVPYSLSGLTSGTGLHTVLASYASQSAITTYTAPLSCTVAAPMLTVVVSTPVCNSVIGTPTANQYTATVTVSLSNVVASTLTITDNGTPISSLNIVADQATASFLVSGISNAASHTVVAILTGGISASMIYTAPVACTVCSMSITTSTLPNGQVGTAYNQTISTTGGTVPLTFAVTAGTLPPGLSLNTTTGAIASTTTSATTSGFTVKVTDALACTVAQSLSITIAAPPPCALTATATPISCNTATSTYAVTGVISLTTAITGTATITDGSQTTTVAIGSGDISVPYTLAGLPIDGTNHTLSVSLPGCGTTSTIYTAPASCLCTSPTCYPTVVSKN
ncbi:putative Ig domain-containing protein [Spirosoma sp.]|uniref:putative Ig domain-containing protein n=1 Tax=Spirosoma sp. TaxID=1899569 RepID=UPI0026097DCE|nr:putative Ig domain-containing protein [Spirosoma sp.]MCX6218562.1 putative Ig domain-containing protein [Spirosoma sp.]